MKDGRFSEDIQLIFSGQYQMSTITYFNENENTTVELGNDWTGNIALAKDGYDTKIGYRTMHKLMVETASENARNRVAKYYKVASTEGVTDKEKREAKLELPMFFSSVRQFNGNSKKASDVVEHTGYVQIDIDHVVKEHCVYDVELTTHLDEFKKAIHDILKSVWTFKSPSRDGIKAFVKIDGINPSNHAELSTWFCNKYQSEIDAYFNGLPAGRHNPQFDFDRKVSKNIARGCFVSYDPTQLVEPKPYTHKPTKPQISKHRSRRKTESELLDEITNATIGNRDETLNENIFKLRKTFDTPKSVIKKAAMDSENPLSETVIDEKLERVDNDATEQKTDIEHKPLFDTTPDGFVDAFKFLGYDLRKDKMNSCIQIQQPHKTGDEWVDLDDDMEYDMAANLERHCSKLYGGTRVPYEVSQMHWNRYTGSYVVDREVNSLNEDGLKRLPKFDQKTKWLREYLFDLFQIDDATIKQWKKDGRYQLYSEMGRLLILAIVARNMQPVKSKTGIAFDLMLILKGPEGSGKSTAFRHLLPIDGYYDDGFKITANPQRQRESINGSALVEISEMAGLRKADVDNYISLLTQTVEPKQRLAYARHTTSHPRFCVFVGTSNKEDLIPANAGDGAYRRWVIFETQRREKSNERIIKWLRQNRDALFSEAIYEWEKNPNMPLVLSDDAIKTQTEMNRGYTTIDSDFVDKVLEIADGYDDYFFTIDVTRQLVTKKLTYDTIGKKWIFDDVKPEPSESFVFEQNKKLSREICPILRASKRYERKQKRIDGYDQPTWVWCVVDDAV